MEALAEVEFFTDGSERRLQASFLLRDGEFPQRNAAGFAAFVARLRSHLPELTGAGAALHPELSRRTRLRWTGAEWGAAGLSYRVAGRDYWVPRGGVLPGQPLPGGDVG